MNGEVRGMSGHHSRRAKTSTWLTPTRIIDALGEFDLDPCCPPVMPWSTAKVMIHYPNDGLATHWPETSRVWMNPPYGNAVGDWLRQLARHPAGGTALIFARTETDAFFDWVWNAATAALFIRGRLNFYNVDGERCDKNAGAPSVLVAYGERDACRLLDANRAGAIEGKFVRIFHP